jgi:hypothetical protein
MKKFVLSSKVIFKSKPLLYHHYSQNQYHLYNNNNNNNNKKWIIKHNFYSTYASLKTSRFKSDDFKNVIYDFRSDTGILYNLNVYILLFFYFQ